LLETPHLVVDLNSRALPVADIDEAVPGDGHAVNGLHAFRLPLPQELAGSIHHGDAAIATRAFAVGDEDIAILTIDEDARGHVERRGVRVERLAFRRPVG